MYARSALIYSALLHSRASLLRYTVLACLKSISALSPSLFSPFVRSISLLPLRRPLVTILVVFLLSLSLAFCLFSFLAGLR